ncbi:MAG: hypothetical protein IIX21_04735 [Clostridia bacterium]|nr:hypothetical protein [Clostridia bacterium]
MREILFRGKRKDNGKWVEGYYARKGVDKDTFKHFICVMTFNVNGNTYSSMFYLTDIEVIPETVGQYTGMTDKNGTKIFEGDVVMKRTYHKKKPCEVVFGVGCFHCGWGGGSSTKDHPYLLNDKQIEVIGNIHDNPELLKNN